MRNST
jgi:cilia- and flagella-associated protein 69